jgi:hypothetical protein
MISARFVGVVLLLAMACTNAKLERVPPPDAPRADNKLSVEGEFCTTDPDDLKFPVKLLFLIDTSTSMQATDPEGKRVDALIEVIDSVIGVDGVEIGLVTFGLGATVLTEKCDDYVARINCTEGFAPPEQALRAIAGAGQAAGTTDFLITLQSAISLLADDMASSDAQAVQNARYQVIFLSDGLPDADGEFNADRTCREAGEWELAGEILDEAGVITEVGTLIDQLVELGEQYDVAQLGFNTAFAAAPNTLTEVKACGSTFMRAMAKQGGGVFRDFSSGEAINFLFVDFTSFKRVFSLKSFLALNVNALPFSFAIDADEQAKSDDPTIQAGIIDSDADGLSDEIERRIGTRPDLTDTDEDGFSDLLEQRLVLSGFDPNDPTDADCAAAQDRGDLDGDGLRDCEERFVGTNPRVYDTDLDGFGDGVEAHYGSNPGLSDTNLDIDFDGVRNAAELRGHSRLDTDDITVLSEHAYRLRVRQLGLQQGQYCYSFRADNISLATTQGAATLTPLVDGLEASPGLGAGAMAPFANRILFEVTEQPFDNPDRPGVPRLACAVAQFDAARQLKNPANGIIRLSPSAFVPATEFNPAVHCIAP